MGTNYYLHTEVCSHCGKGSQEIHIGKISAGWCFSLHVASGPDEGIPSNLEEWKRLWNNKAHTIRDEYGCEISSAEMLQAITERSWDWDKRKSRKYPDLFGYKSYEDFMESNHAVEGPNGLLRHKIDGRHCIGHGEGTYDYITGEFS